MNLVVSSKVQLKRQKYNFYSPTKLTDVSDDKLNVANASRKYYLPEQTLRDRVLGLISINNVKSGPPPVFECEQEARMVQHIKEMGAVGYAYTRAEVFFSSINLAKELLAKGTLFTGTLRAIRQMRRKEQVGKRKRGRGEEGGEGKRWRVGSLEEVSLCDPGEDAFLEDIVGFTSAVEPSSPLPSDPCKTSPAPDIQATTIPDITVAILISQLQPSLILMSLFLIYHHWNHPSSPSCPTYSPNRNSSPNQI
ncbi:Hypothetical predicted protein [Mytilus galloprovincialis]|uniref:Uncharacterized protein n=1 Tax=Mytilus galloprovincialis TaxID=29158 RepID=A0A8B6BPW3_MYTGA|nr:Hypothetical predicted protein [Mytilus galloprovincialis]